MDDQFLKQKLHGKLSDFVSAFLEQHNVSHEYCPDLLNSINNILDYLEYLAYISKNDATPPLLAQRNLLKFKLHILKRNKKGKVSKASLTSDVPRPSDVFNLMSDVAISDSAVNIEAAFSEQEQKRQVSSAQRKKNFGMGTTNKERIFNYIKKTPDMRTKDVMTEFSALSGRTVKRNLKELIDEGFLKKKSDGVAVYYTCG